MGVLFLCANQGTLWSINTVTEVETASSKAVVSQPGIAFLRER